VFGLRNKSSGNPGRISHRAQDSCARFFFAQGLQRTCSQANETGQAKRSFVPFNDSFLELGFLMEIFDYDNILLLPRLSLIHI
jgi:hypothetical protein